MTALVCNRGCDHDERWCRNSIEHDKCERCERDGEPSCNVARFVFDNFADCQRRFSNHSCGHLTGFTRRAHAALVHLGDAATVADDSNRPGVLAAIASLFTCRSIKDELSFAHRMVDDDKVTADASAGLRSFLLAEHEPEMLKLHTCINDLLQQRLQTAAMLSVELTGIALRLASVLPAVDILGAHESLKLSIEDLRRVVMTLTEPEVH